MQAGARLPPACSWSSTGREQVLGSPGLGTAVTAVAEAEFGVCATPPPQAASSPLSSDCLYGTSSGARRGTGGARRGWGCWSGFGAPGRN